MAIGLRITVRHYYDFRVERAIVGSDLGTPEAWDRLRARTTGRFSLPEAREGFVRLPESHEEIADRARAIDDWLANAGIDSIASYGVGTGVLEWWLTRLRAGRRITCTDYAAGTVRRLNDLAPELHACGHDLRRDNPLTADLHLFHRIDTELSNREWHDVLERFRSESIFIAAEVLDLRRLTVELLARPLIRASRAGFLRTRAALEALWLTTHQGLPLRMHDLPAWSLTPLGAVAERRSAGV